MTALVRSVTPASMLCVVTHAVLRSTSTARGTAPSAETADAVGTAVNAGTSTSSPGPIPAADRASWSAPAPDDTPTQCCAPSHWANSVSNADSSAPKRKLPLAAIRSAAFANAEANRCPRRLRSTTGTTDVNDRRSRWPPTRHRGLSSPSIREIRQSACNPCGTNRCRCVGDRRATGRAGDPRAARGVNDRRRRSRPTSDRSRARR